MSNYGPQMGMPGQQMAMPPPKKKGLSTGCMIVLFSVLGLFLIVGGIIAYISYKVATNPDVQNAVGAIGDAAEIAAQAQKAPGTNELRALGCEQAMAIDAVKMAKLGDKFTDAGASKTPPEVSFIVTCTVNMAATTPSCGDAVKAYIKGASPSSKFMLTVQSHGKTTCGGIYSPSGAQITNMGP